MFRKAVLFLPVACPGCLARLCGPLSPPLPHPPPLLASVQEAEENLYLTGGRELPPPDLPPGPARDSRLSGALPPGRQCPLARLREAELLGLLGDWQGSLRRYQALLAREPETDIALKARYGMGRAYFKLGQYQQAAQVLDNLTAADFPRSLRFSTQALLAEIALKQGQVTQAFARLRLAAQDLPSGTRSGLKT